MLVPGHHSLGQIKVKVVYFAQAREFAGIKEDEFVLSAPASVKNLFLRMMTAHPDLGKIGSIIRPLVNGRMVAEDVQLNDGDRVAIMPPVAGG
jgi:molybdopterin converting factor small subunit